MAATDHSTASDTQDLAACGGDGQSVITYPTSDDFARELNDLFVSTFHQIERFEEQSLRSFAGLNLSVNEIHVVEIVGRGSSHGAGGITVSRVAAALDVRMPTATIAINRLVDKGLVIKEHDIHDQRLVNVSLTREGRRAYLLHALFHRRMVDEAVGEMTDDERDSLVRCVHKLKAFFEKSSNKEAAFAQAATDAGVYDGETSSADSEVFIEPKGQ